MSPLNETNLTSHDEIGQIGVCELADDELESVGGGIGTGMEMVDGRFIDYLYCEKCGMRFGMTDQVGAVMHEMNCTGVPQK